MEESKGVLENEGKDEVSVMIPPSTDIQTENVSNTTQLGSSPNSKIKSTTSRKLQQIPVPTSSFVLSDVEMEDEDEDVYKAAKNLILRRKEFKRKVAWSFIGWIFVCLVGILIASLTVHKLKNTLIWGLKLWKWTVLVLAILCGGLISKWLVKILVFCIKRRGLRKDFMYFVNEMQRSVQFFIWLTLILMAWVLLINRGVERSRDTTKILDHATNALEGCLIGAAIWLVKTFLIELVASSFQHGRFIDQIQDLVFYRYVVRTLSGNPLMETKRRVGRSKTSRLLSFRKVNIVKEGGQEDVIHVLHRIEQDKAWTTKVLINDVLRSRLLIATTTLELEEDGREKYSEITNEMEAVAAAYSIFRNVAKPGSNYIDEYDLLRFMSKEEVDLAFPLFPEAETGRIDRSSLTKWLVGAYKENEALTHSLNYTTLTLAKLNRLVSGIAIVIAVIVWCLMMGLLTTKALLLISSQILLVTFMFGNTAKTVFEAIVFVFIMHPFDVGDQCVIDGEQMLVEEINILNTIFRRNDMQKIFYPNSVLLTKPIGNSFRNPEIGDCVEFNIDLFTPVEKIGALKARIKRYLEAIPTYWDPSHSILLKDIDNTGNLKMALSVTHNINYQNSGEKSSRRSDLIFELKKIFEDLNIKYRLLPQEVHVKYI